MNTSNIINVVMANIDVKDYPDFVDAYVESAEWKSTGNKLTDDEIDKLNNKCHSFCQEQAHQFLF